MPVNSPVKDYVPGIGIHYARLLFESVSTIGSSFRFRNAPNIAVMKMRRSDLPDRPSLAKAEPQCKLS
jgi:hypothetical protein